MIKRMKRFLSALAVLMIYVFNAGAQNVCFWTNDDSALPIRVYVDRNYVGDVTAAHRSLQALDDFHSRPGAVQDDGCLYLTVDGEGHQLTAVNRYGEVYGGWPGDFRPHEDRMNYVQMRRGGFRPAPAYYRDSVDWAWLWYGWDPIWSPVTYHTYGWRDLDIDSSDDEVLLIAMAVAAFGGLGAMTAAAVRNWNFPDNRFPYFSAGYEFQYFCGLEQLRNVAKFKYRFGNLGGISLIGDMGYAHDLGYHSDIFMMDSRVARDSFTWSAGFAMEYGGFNFGLRYKPALSASEDTFAIASIDYDFVIGKHFILNLESGFGVSGYGDTGLLERFEFPFGFGLSYKF